MGCVQSKSAQSPAAEVLPTSVKVANSTKTGVAPGNPGQPAQTGDPIYLDRADTWGQPTETPLDNSAAFQIKSEGVQGYQILLAARNTAGSFSSMSWLYVQDPDLYMFCQAMRVCKSMWRMLRPQTGQKSRRKKLRQQRQPHRVPLPMRPAVEAALMPMGHRSVLHS